MQFPTLTTDPVVKTSGDSPKRTEPAEDTTTSGFAALMGELLEMLMTKAAGTEPEKSADESTMQNGMQVEAASTAESGEAASSESFTAPQALAGSSQLATVEATAEELASMAAAAAKTLSTAAEGDATAVAGTPPPTSAIEDSPATTQQLLTKLGLAALEGTEADPPVQHQNNKGTRESAKNAAALESQLGRMLKSEDAAKLAATARSMLSNQISEAAAELSPEAPAAIESAPVSATGQSTGLTVLTALTPVSDEADTPATAPLSNEKSSPTLAMPITGREPVRAEQQLAVSPPANTGTRLEDLPQALVRQVRMQLQDEQGTVSMKLHPASLGEVGVEVVHRGQEVSVKLISGNALVRETLETHSPMLRESLARDGVQHTQIVVASEQSSGLFLSQESRQSGNQQQLSGRRRAAANHGYAEGLTETASRTQMPTRHDGALNLFI